MAQRMVVYVVDNDPITNCHKITVVIVKDQLTSMSSIYDYSELESSTKDSHLSSINLVLRIFGILVTHLLSLAAANYCVGQLIEYETVDFFCPIKTKDQVHSHSIQYNLNTGSTDICWRIEQENLDQSVLFDIEPNLKLLAITLLNQYYFVLDSVLLLFYF